MKKHSISLLILFFLSPVYAIFDGHESATSEVTYLLQLLDIEDYACEQYDVNDQENTTIQAHAHGLLAIDVCCWNLMSFSFQQNLKRLPFLECSLLEIAKRAFLIEHHRQCNYKALLQQLPKQVLHLLYDTFLI